MVADNDHLGDLSALHHHLNHHIAVLPVYRGLVGAVLNAGHIIPFLGGCLLLKQLLFQHKGRRFHRLALCQVHVHHIPPRDPSKGHRSHDPSAAGDEFAPDAAYHLAGGVQAGNGAPALIHHLHILVHRNAAQSHDHQSLDGNRIVLIPLDLVHCQAVSRRRTAEIPAKLVGPARLHSGVIRIHRLRQGILRHADHIRQLLQRVCRPDQLVAHAVLRLIIVIPHKRPIAGFQILDNLVRKDIVLHRIGLLLQSGLPRNHLVQSLVDKPSALLIHIDASGFPHVHVADGPLALAVL